MTKPQKFCLGAHGTVGGRNTKGFEHLSNDKMENILDKLIDMFLECDNQFDTVIPT